MALYIFSLVLLACRALCQAGHMPDCAVTGAFSDDCRATPYEQRRAGAAMLQTDSGVLKEVPSSLVVSQNVGSGERSLENDVFVIEKEMTELKSKTESLETAIGHKSATPELLSVPSSAGTLSERVVALEADATDVDSRVTTLENEVQGSSKASLVSMPARDVGLQNRVRSLQTMVASLRIRVTKMEHKVTGFLQKDEASSKFLENDVSILENKMGALKSKTMALEAKVGNRISLLTAGSEKGRSRKAEADDIKSRVVALEQDVADVKSRTASLEDEVDGPKGAPFLLDTTALKPDTLQDRVAVMQATVANLQVRTHKLENTVAGMLQKGGVILLEKEMAVLKSKTNVLETSLGHTGSLLAVSKEEGHINKAGDIKSRVGTLEQAAADVKSRLTAMETEVEGPRGFSLLDAETQTNKDTDGLRDRVASLRATVDKLKSRVQKLEWAVTGLLQEDNHSALVESQASSKGSAEKYLDAEVTLLEDEMAVLTSKTVVLEKNVGHASGASSGVSSDESSEASLVDIHRALSGDDALKARVSSLEQKASDLDSRVGSLENEVSGGSVASLAQDHTTRSETDKPLGLKERVEVLMSTVKDLKVRVQHLEVDVTGLLQRKAEQTPASLVASSNQKVEFISADVSLMESEMKTLQQKTAALEEKLGHQAVASDTATLESSSDPDEGTIETAEAAAVDETNVTAESLVEVSGDSKLKKRVGVLEANAADVNSRIASMESLVRGESAMSMVELAKFRAQERPLGLKRRVEILKATVDDLKKRVQSLEVDVTGLLQEGAQVSAIDTAKASTSSSSRAKNLHMHVTLLEKDMVSLKKATGSLEAKAGNKASLSSRITEAAQRLVHIQESEGGPLKKRVIALEADAQDVESRVTSLEDDVLGMHDLSLIEASRTLASTSGLTSRILALNASMTNLQNRVSSLRQRMSGQ